MGVLDALNPISSVATAARAVIGAFKLDPEKQVEAEMAIRDAELEGMRLQQERETNLLNQQSKTIRAEIGKGSWLTANWRPIVMLTLTGLIVAHWMGWSAPNLPTGEVEDLLDIVKIGLGGYVVGRTGEKIAQVLTGGKGGR